MAAGARIALSRTLDPELFYAEMSATASPR